MSGTAESRAGYDKRPLLDDPRVKALAERIHKALGHDDWQPTCGHCFDRAFDHVWTENILAGH